MLAAWGVANSSSSETFLDGAPGSVVKSGALLGDSAVIIFQWITLTFVCQSIDVLGIITNIINIICFVKQGFKDPVNVSLLGLACSDIGCLATLIWTNICFTPAFMEADLPFDAVEVTYLTSVTPHVAFSRITGWITALITMERCLCITAPLKVKAIVTTKRVSVIIIFIFIVLLSSLAPIYVVNKLGPKFFPERNKTLVGLIFTEERETVEKISFVINNVFVSFTAFALITVCTVTMVIKLHKLTKWRRDTTTSVQAENLSTRNQKVAKMVLMISTLFIACFIPESFTFIAMSTEPGLAVDGKYRHILTMLGGLTIVLKSINSSANILIYYRMSNKYRVVFNQMFCINSKQELASI